ncbi:MAG: hypothetical protein Q8P39_02740 [Candidatus Yanofskybacteria bacterium]|nr:hypothetical protein [Candidatus Yanofskybacteria bacterium]
MNGGSADRQATITYLEDQEIKKIGHIMTESIMTDATLSYWAGANGDEAQILRVAAEIRLHFCATDVVQNAENWILTEAARRALRIRQQPVAR